MRDNVHRIKDPDVLAAFSIYLNEQTPSNGYHHIILSLFAPLSKPEVLAQCRDPSTRFLRDGNGNRMLNSPSNNECLDLTPLHEAWRTVWKTLPTALVDKVTLDITIPADSNQREKSWWYLMTDEEGNEVHIDQMVPARWVLLFATVMSMRSECKGGVSFEVVCESKGPKEMQTLKDICERLSKASL